MQLGEILAIVGIGLAIIVALLWREVSALPSSVKWPGAAFGAGLILSAVIPLNPLHTVIAFALISVLWGVGWSAKNDLDDPFRKLRSPPAPESFGVRLDRSERQIDAYRMLLGLKIVNKSDMHLNDRCFVKILETDLGEAGASMLPSEIALRTENQIRRGQKGQSRFTLSIGEVKTVPVLFCEPHRRLDWFFLDENGKRFAFPATKGRTVNLLVGVFGGEPHIALITVEAGEDWAAMASIKRVPNDFGLRNKAGQAQRKT